ncbi:hypothetical protein ACFOWM_03225 [Ferruginibacter yonginensis]|uniref:Uncharacterized protein n=1 Tax=Ferruginibacter yonginensis TaxID=1310416 RepID=A0ABV8QQ65_9BACT
MKKNIILLIVWLCCNQLATAQNGLENKLNNAYKKADKTVNKAKTIIAIFQPYLVKAKELYGQGKALAKNVKGSIKNGNQNNNENNGFVTTNTTAPTNESNNNNTASNNSDFVTADPYTTATTATPEYYLPINNEAAINSDGSGNWGNQNNGLYGNCLDAMTGTVLGMGEAAEKSGTIDLLFFAPADGQNTYYLMTPSFARNNSSATYMTQHTSDAVTKWNDVVESEIALTKLTIGQFNQIQNNNQITSAVKNAQNYAGYYASVGNKLDGQVFGLKTELENRTVYALIAIDKHIGTSGNNGYLKIRVKTLGVDVNNNGTPDANLYIR